MRFSVEPRRHLPLEPPAPAARRPSPCADRDSFRSPPPGVLHCAGQVPTIRSRSGPIGAVSVLAGPFLQVEVAAASRLVATRLRPSGRLLGRTIQREDAVGGVRASRPFYPGTGSCLVGNLVAPFSWRFRVRGLGYRGARGTCLGLGDPFLRPPGSEALGPSASPTLNPQDRPT